MSQTKICRLCVNVCSDYASLYNETGQKNNICERSLKYFDPMFLSADQNPGSVVLCLECSGHISVFYNFQQAVFQAQRRLREGEREIEFEFKKKMSEELILDNSHVTVKQDDSISLPDLELAEEFMVTDNLKSEDNQVNSQTVNQPILKCENTEEEDTEQSKDQPLSTYDTSESEKGSDSDDYQPSTRMKRKRKQNVDEPIPLCENTEEFGDKDDKIIRNNSDTEQSEDHPLSISDTSESEKGSDSDYNQSTTLMIRTRTPRKDLDAVIAQWKPNLDCVVCKKSLPNFKSLSDHFCLEHPNEKCRVECCSRRMYTRYRVVDHARLHLNPDKVKCNQCNSYYASRFAMYVHMGVVHTTANIEISDKIDNSKLRSKSSIKCVICKTSYAKFSQLKKHYRLTHPTKDCYALCCERKFHRACLFEEHIRFHRDPNAFKCNICGKRLRASDALKQHMRSHHDPNAFKCEICGKRLCASEPLKIHMQLHRDPNAFKCEICGQRMSRPQILRHHMIRWHSNIKTADP